ncbi:hypothetical protein C2E21_8951 [Chlorella sorokiniana]|uniref:DUF7781 domain-containing protein n=1 Tax=Chlorella sorokiniana TaxID=3076 RepID=A0A2P6TCU6_CHLSO|nr:hypothetical protein C2E21_8951 [Chlorella sorokiniana]|eukprot:PRW20457.1 hypothetical protein C2E21_8951 [Chlorella sorokiniana]
MGSLSRSESGTLSEDYSHYSGYSHGSVPSTLADLLERFTVEAQPDCTLKLRSAAGPVVLGADLTRVMAAKTNTAALVIKPSSGEVAWWRRLRIDNSGTLTLRSRKLSWWLLTLDITGHANPFSKSFDLSYRVATKWDVTKGEYRNKKRMQLSDNMEARAHWTISYSLPAIEGSMGTAARHINREVHADVGYAHLDIPRLELVVWPRGKPAATADSGSNGGSGSGAAEGVASSADAAFDAASVGVNAAAGSSGSPSGPASISAAAAEEHLPEYLRGEASGGTAVASRSSAGRRKAALQQLNAHVASLSGRWWETFGSGSGSSSRG